MADKITINQDKENNGGYNGLVTVEIEPKQVLDKIELFIRGYNLSQKNKDWNIAILDFYDPETKQYVQIKLASKSGNKSDVTK